MASLHPLTIIFLYPLLLFSFPLSNSIGVEEPTTSRLKNYIVNVEKPDIAAVDGSTDIETWYKSFLPSTTTANSSSTEQERIIHMYSIVASGFAARLTEEEVNEMKTKEGFVHAHPSRIYSPKTTHTPSFLGLNLPMGLWNRSNFGEGVIIGVIDTGITPDHPSFSGEGMPPPPPKWKGRCEFDDPSFCNNKLIGARALLNASVANGDNVTVSPIDEYGHGTHTASTAAGAFVANAHVLGNARGTASGMAPRAHLATYRVCGLKQCEEADMLAALEAATSDGVDVISMSLGLDESTPLLEDASAIGAFRAMEKGVLSSFSAGNGGPDASSLINDAPWVLTVGASTIDRDIRVTLELGNGLEFNGQSLFMPKNYTPTFFPLVDAGASGNPNASFCGNGSLDGMDVAGKVVLCEFGGRGLGAVQMGATVRRAGGVAVILMNEESWGFITYAELNDFPGSNVGYSDGIKVREYINSAMSPTVQLNFKGTVFDTTFSPAMADFSSRGPSTVYPEFLKPDITGPGVNILAAWLPEATSNAISPNFDMLSGTSMSAPHLCGIAALIKSVHPDWSPAAIKSAIMTTAEVLDRNGLKIVDEQHQPADLFAVGAGHVSPLRASDPGLVYDICAEDYFGYLCGLGYTGRQMKIITGRPVDCSRVQNITGNELNYPSITVPFREGIDSVTLERRVKNVGETNSTYWVEIEAPTGVSVDVEPKTLQFSEGKKEMTFKVTFRRSTFGGKGGVCQGYLKWASKYRTVRSPISVTIN